MTYYKSRKKRKPPFITKVELQTAREISTAFSAQFSTSNEIQPANEESTQLSATFKSSWDIQIE